MALIFGIRSQRRCEIAQEIRSALRSCRRRKFEGSKGEWRSSRYDEVCAKAMRGRIALQSASREMNGKSCSCFAQLWECVRVLASMECADMSALSKAATCRRTPKALPAYRRTGSAKLGNGSSRFAIALGVRARLRVAFARVAGAPPRIQSDARLKRTFSACTRQFEFLGRCPKLNMKPRLSRYTAVLPNGRRALNHDTTTN